MPSPTTHSLLSPSNAHRWLVCTNAPRFEDQFPADTSKYAEEGTLAHAVCELFCRQRFKDLPKRTFTRELKRLQADEHYNPEMLTTAEAYVNYLTEKANTFPTMPSMAFEVNVDLSEWIPDGRGQCDSAMIGGDTLHITDYKHGQGTPVDAKENPQMRLYALGALRLYQAVYGDSIKYVSMGICQPRLFDTVSDDCLTVEELLAWGEEVKVKARIAYDGNGEFCPGEHQCKFCRARYKCPARAQQNTALEDFKDCVTPDKAGQPTDAEARKVLGMPRILTDAEIGNLLTRGATLVAWYNDLKEYALSAILNGATIPGYKVVEGRSNRTFADVAKAFAVLEAAGIPGESLYKTEPRTLSDIEKMIGKKRFGELMGEYVVKPRGKATLAEADDMRAPYNSAASDFQGVSSDGR